MKTGIIRYPGSNCDFDALNYFENSFFIWHNETELKEHIDLLVIPGGFAFGDRVYDKATGSYYTEPATKAIQSPVSKIIDVKITFKDSNDVVTVPYDSSAQPELAKVLIGKAFEPGDTHNSLNIPISENQINSDQMMANIQFKIITESGVEDSKR